jgi:hypothetical protein
MDFARFIEPITNPYQEIEAMAEYILNNASNSDSANLVHLDSCAELKGSGSALYLGSYGTPVAAYNIAKGLKHAVDYCPTCLSKMTAQ